MKKETARCPWPTNELSIRYHDTEWGVPVHDDRVLFEYLILEGAQAGLSWQTVLNKRENYRAAFNNFDVEKIARYNEARVMKLMNNPGIIRNQLKIRSTILNAKSFLKACEKFGSFDKYLDRAYEDLEHKHLPMFGAANKTLHHLRRFRVDVAKLTDEVTHIAKFFGDWYLARVYLGARDRFYLDQWRTSVEQRLAQLDKLYSVVHSEVNEKRMLWMEIIIVIFFAIDLVILLWVKR